MKENAIKAATDKPVAGKEAAATPADKPAAAGKTAKKAATKTTRKTTTKSTAVKRTAKSPATKVALKQPAAKQPAKKVTTKTATKAAPVKEAKATPKQAGKAVEVKEKIKKPKLVRDSFTMPEAEYQVLADVKKAFLKKGVSVKKSELLRAGLALIRSMDLGKLNGVIRALAPIKAGRPKKEK